MAKVAKGSNFDLRVQAFRGDTEIPVIPQKVEVRYRDEGGGRDRKTMKNIGRPQSPPLPRRTPCSRNTATSSPACFPRNISTSPAAMPA